MRYGNIAMLERERYSDTPIAADGNILQLKVLSSETDRHQLEESHRCVANVRANVRLA
jgi:hypothetical protein